MTRNIRWVKRNLPPPTCERNIHDESSFPIALGPDLGCASFSARARSDVHRSKERMKSFPQTHADLYPFHRIPWLGNRETQSRKKGRKSEGWLPPLRLAVRGQFSIKICEKIQFHLSDVRRINFNFAVTVEGLQGNLTNQSCFFTCTCKTGRFWNNLGNVCQPLALRLKSKRIK